MSEKIYFEPTWELPNPFYKADGSIMSTKAEWEEKRKAYIELLSEMYYGKMPGRPQTLAASELSNETICQNTVCHKVVRLCAQGEEAPVFFNVHVYREAVPCEEKLIPVVIPAADTLPEEIISMAANRALKFAALKLLRQHQMTKKKSGRVDVQRRIQDTHGVHLQCGHGCKAVLSTGLKRRKI